MKHSGLYFLVYSFPSFEKSVHTFSKAYYLEYLILLAYSSKLLLKE